MALAEYLGRKAGAIGRGWQSNIQDPLTSLFTRGMLAGDRYRDTGEGVGAGLVREYIDEPLSQFGAEFTSGLNSAVEAGAGTSPTLGAGRGALLEPTPKLAIEEYLENAKVDQPAVGADGIPEALRRPPDMAYPEPVAAPQGHVRATINGREYDYSNGREGGAPLAGGQVGSLFGREWSNMPSDQTHEFAGQGQGAYSQMTENPAMKTLGQLQDEQAIADARPAPGGGSVGEQRGIAQEIAKKKAEADAIAQGQIAAEKGKSGIRLEEQEKRRNDYEAAITQEVNFYQAAKARIEASAVPDEKKAQLLAEAQARHDAQRQMIREAFGFGSNLSAALRQD